MNKLKNNFVCKGQPIKTFEWSRCKKILI
jgi:hypothetical protein